MALHSVGSNTGLPRYHMSLSFVAHLALVKMGLELFVCRPLVKVSKCGAEVTYLEADPTVRCNMDQHLRWQWLLGLPLLLVYAVGIPLAAFLLLYRRRHKLQEDRCIVIYGFM